MKNLKEIVVLNATVILGAFLLVQGVSAEANDAEKKGDKNRHKRELQVKMDAMSPEERKVFKEKLAREYRERLNARIEAIEDEALKEKVKTHMEEMKNLRKQQQELMARHREEVKQFKAAFLDGLSDEERKALRHVFSRGKDKARDKSSRRSSEKK